jgi:hypothetical protein
VATSLGWLSAPILIPLFLVITRMPSFTPLSPMKLKLKTGQPKRIRQRPGQHFSNARRETLEGILANADITQQELLKTAGIRVGRFMDYISVPLATYTSTSTTTAKRPGRIKKWLSPEELEKLSAILEGRAPLNKKGSPVRPRTLADLPTWEDIGFSLSADRVWNNKKQIPLADHYTKPGELTWQSVADRQRASADRLRNQVYAGRKPRIGKATDEAEQADSRSISQYKSEWEGRPEAIRCYHRIKQ